MVEVEIIHAYNPRNGPRGEGRKGSEHYVLRHDLHTGRLHRKAGDALCKPARKFWDLGTYRGYSRADCKRCLDIAARVGVTAVHPNREANGDA